MESGYLDAVLCGLLIASLLYLTFRHFSIREAFSAAKHISSTRNIKARTEANGLLVAVAAFARYNGLAQSQWSSMQASFSRLSRSHKRLGIKLGYLDKLEKLSKANLANSAVTNGIAQLAISRHQLDIAFTNASTNELVKVREALKHFVRDWSTDGAKEREVIFNPILDVLAGIKGELGDMPNILVPGSGLGRLAWEIHNMGFATTAVELSPYMNLAFEFLLSPKYTFRPFQHAIQPHSHWFSHQRGNEALFRSVAFPDVLPRLSETFSVVAEDFLNLQPPIRTISDGSTTSGYDIIVTLFFIDTSLNIVATLEQIHRLLRPGGRWINLGPLLWTGGFQASMELSLEEVLRLADLVGFDVDKESRRTIDCEYTADSAAMMKWIYEVEFWVGRKR